MSSAGVDSKSCPSLFHSPVGDVGSVGWSIGASTPALQVLPHHRQSAAAAAEAMLSHGSPLSGLHKLALSICARKKGGSDVTEPLTLLASAPGRGTDKENMSPASHMLHRKVSGNHHVLALHILAHHYPESIKLLLLPGACWHVDHDCCS